MAKLTTNRQLNFNYAPNPMLIFTLDAGILQIVFDVVMRSALEKGDITRSAAVAGPKAYYEMCCRALETHQNHLRLLGAEGALNNPVMPIGVQTAWVPSDDLIVEYRALRDRTVKALEEINDLAVKFPRMEIPSDFRETWNLTLQERHRSLDYIWWGKALAPVRNGAENFAAVATFQACGDLLTSGLETSRALFGALMRQV